MADAVLTPSTTPPTAAPAAAPTPSIEAASGAAVSRAGELRTAAPGSFDLFGGPVPPSATAPVVTPNTFVEKLLLEPVTQQNSDRLKNLPDQFIAQVRTEIYAAITPENFDKLPPEFIARIKPEQFAKVFETHANNMNEKQLQALKPDQISEISERGWSIAGGIIPQVLNSKQFAQISVTPERMQVINEELAKYQSFAAEKGMFTPEAARALKPAEIRNLTVIEIERFEPAAVRELGASLGRLPRAAIQAMTPEQVGAISKEQIATMEAKPLSEMGGLLRYLTPEARSGIEASTILDPTVKKAMHIYIASLEKSQAAAAGVPGEPAPQVKAPAQYVKNGGDKGDVELRFHDLNPGTWLMHFGTREIEGVTVKTHTLGKSSLFATEGDNLKFKTLTNEIFKQREAWGAYDQLVSKFTKEHGLLSKTDADGVARVSIDAYPKELQPKLQELLDRRYDQMMLADQKMQELAHFCKMKAMPENFVSYVTPTGSATELAHRYIEFAPTHLVGQPKAEAAPAKHSSSTGGVVIPDTAGATISTSTPTTVSAPSHAPARPAESAQSTYWREKGAAEEAKAIADQQRRAEINSGAVGLRQPNPDAIYAQERAIAGAQYVQDYMAFRRAVNAGYMGLQHPQHSGWGRPGYPVPCNADGGWSIGVSGVWSSNGRSAVSVGGAYSSGRGGR